VTVGCPPASFTRRATHTAEGAAHVAGGVDRELGVSMAALFGRLGALRHAAAAMIFGFVERAFTFFTFFPFFTSFLGRMAPAGPFPLPAAPDAPPLVSVFFFAILADACGGLQGRGC